MNAIFELIVLAVIAIPVSAQAQAIKELRGSAPEAKVSVPAPAPSVIKTPSSVVYNKIAIVGGKTFLSKTKEALVLLEGSTTFTKISPYISGIKEDKHSGMMVYTLKPIFAVGNATWNRGAAWYAGAIAHDTYHSLLYFKAKKAGHGEPPLDAWQGKAAEQKCLTVQAEVLIEVKAEKDLVDYVKKLISNPTYQNVLYTDRDW